jgi:uracil-DNA glycosylase
MAPPRVLSMQSDQLMRLRQVAVDRLESLHLAGVMQLPRSTRRAIGSRQNTGASDVTPQTEPGEVSQREGSRRIAESPGLPVSAEPAARVDFRTTGTEPELATIKKAAPELNAAAALLVSPSPGYRAENPAITLEILQQQVAGCTRCSELAATRTQTVFGVGKPKARLCFLGEAPGADEDKTGIPFVGRGGQLLTKIIEACRLKRDDVYILNMIKCRPPSNRNPLPTELDNCRGYLETQLDLIRPEFICCLGAVASQNLLGTSVAIGKLRGKFHSYKGAKVVCTYHPAFLLRSPAFKKETWEDMKMLMREMGVELQ